MKKVLLLFFTVFGTASLFSQSDYKLEILKFREIYKNEFLKEDRSPLEKEDLDFLVFFDPDPNYRVTASFVETPDAEPFDLATYSGITKPYRQYGWLTFNLKGQNVKMALYQSLQLRVMPQYRDYLFLPFKDATNGNETYGGGRYIDLNKKDIQGGRVEVDFNKAYNPWCAFADGFNCPIPPAENHLKMGIFAGEKNFGKEK